MHKQLKDISLVIGAAPGRFGFNLMEEVISAGVNMVDIFGNENAKPVTYQNDLYDEYHERTNTLYMARTTGNACTAVADMILKGIFSHKGVIAPECLGEREDYFQYIFNYLKNRGLYYGVQRREG